jgi:hypothetical protein
MGVMFDCVCDVYVVPAVMGPYGLPHGYVDYAFAVSIHVLLNVLIRVVSHCASVCYVSIGRNASVHYVSTIQCQAIYSAFLNSRHDHICMHKYV